MKKYIFIMSIIVSTICSSCDDMLDNIQPYLDAGETIYVGKVDSLTASSGRNRIQLEGYYMYGVTQKKCIIRWTSMNEEEKLLELDVVRKDPVDKFEVLIENLDEGQYEFSITTYDSKGNSSIESIVEGYVYGGLYESNLINRKIETLKVDKGVVVITWRPANSALRSEVYYTDVEGNNKMIEVPVTETQTHISGCNLNQKLRWKTIYLPEKTAIDFFYSQESEMAITN